MNYNNLECPCKDCKDRAAECHAHCDKYLDFANECKKIRDKRFKEKENAYAKTENVYKQARRSGTYLRNVFF